MRLSPRKAVGLLCAAMSLPMTAVRAETLEQAWASARGTDFGLRAAQFQEQAAEAARSAALRQRFVSVSANGFAVKLDEAPTIKSPIEDNLTIPSPIKFPLLPSSFSFPVPADLQNFQLGEDKFTQVGLQATLPLYTGGRLTNLTKAAESQVSAAGWNLRQTEQELKINVAEAYVNVLRAQGGAAISDREVEAVSGYVQDVQNLFDQQMVAKSDLLSVQVYLADSRQRNLQIKNAVQLAQSFYNKMVGRPLDAPVSLEPLEPAAEVGGESLESLTEQAIKNRPELNNLSAQTESLRYAAKAIKGGLLPQVGLLGGMVYLDLDTLEDNTIGYAGVGASWTLFDSGVTRKQAEALSKRRISSEELFSQARELISLQVRQTWLAREEARNRLNVARTSLDSAEENQRVTRDRYREGMGTNTEVLEAETRRSAAFTSYNNAKYDAVYADLRLKYVVGGI
ncbi:MAG: TolC family protein [Pseudomonadota bacterium]